MIKLYEILLLLFVFFLVSTGIYILFTNIGISNNNLDLESRQDLTRLNIYNDNNTNPFLNNDKPTEINYSLTAYSNTGDFEQSNIETKGALESILDILGDNKLSALSSPITFMFNLSPLPAEAFNWMKNMLFAFIGITVFIAGIAAWKAGAWSNG